VALNAVANRRILEETPFKRVFIPPAADDSGLAVGCAYYGWTNVLGKERTVHEGSPFLGRSYSEDEIARALGTHTKDLVVDRPTDLVATAAAYLAEGNTLGWFQGGCEFGPRALGHRSILADPRQAALRDHINARIKFREDFRPFAPAVLAEDAATYFDLSQASPYMLFVVPVRAAWRARLAAVTHVDGTARVQTVDPQSDPLFHGLLSAFKHHSGLGMLLNTSLNRRGEPMVETPAEALALLRETDLHGMVLGSYFVSKRAKKSGGGNDG
jgi:carbamoyltransferase